MRFYMRNYIYMYKKKRRYGKVEMYLGNWKYLEFVFLFFFFFYEE